MNGASNESYSYSASASQPPSGASAPSTATPKEADEHRQGEQP